VSNEPPAAAVSRGDRGSTRHYVGVIAVEALVLLGIWLFQRYFGS
jgi:hypothetical protein